MLLGNIKAYFYLVRPLNLLVVLLTMGGFRYAYSLPNFQYQNISPLPEGSFFLALLSILLVTASGYIINDYFDIATDTINKPNKTYISKSISKQKALVFYISLNLLSPLFALGVNSSFLLIVFGTSTLLFFYALYLKRIALLGNMLVAMLSAIVPLITVWLDIQFAYNNNPNEGYFSLYSFPIVISSLAFITSLAREITKDIQDMEGDKHIKALTLPVITSAKIASYVALFLLLISCGLIFIFPPIITNDFYLIYFAIFVIAPLFLSIKTLYKATDVGDYISASKKIKLAMFSVIIFVWLKGLVEYVIFR